ncbi:cell division protein ZapA [Agaricicola taiwanensis]|uniref:Cell division protein ZapA n=1 Tax=Agaricicola taiwanensis TaxID=591372 RepID=A0A8J2VY77_9RHOB|nr:cell division protein ZapA [Agaricicola taiwanensis]GGE38991.1 cell division protein ZapA [Agaricicola taiwanensis]
MAQVTVTIAGRSYRMACDDGQEEHLRELGRMLDEKIEELRGAFGEIGDMRLAVMAAITMADELAETRRRVASLEREVQLLSSSEHEEQIARALDGVAGRLERIASDLNARTRNQDSTGAEATPGLD